MKKNIVKTLNISIVGSGYVGMSLAVLLAKNNKVTVYDINNDRVMAINKKQSTVSDVDIENQLKDSSLQLTATSDKRYAYKNADYIVIATPTDFDDVLNNFDTNSVDSVVDDALEYSSENCLLVIKSTLPIGHTRSLQKKHNTKRIIFSPEFLREGSALRDNLFPSRIIVGNESGKKSLQFLNILKDSAMDHDICTMLVSSSEAESIKLFSNTYLAMRVAFFNELDSFSYQNNLNTKNIIQGVCMDERIGENYNNPSFGYGGYCLPKDTKQLLSNFSSTPQNLIESIINSNATRKDFIVSKVMEMNPKTVGCHRLIMKDGSDNYRSSAIEGIFNRLIENGVKVIIFEPTLLQNSYQGIEVKESLKEFKLESDLIISNRLSKELLDVKEKLICRDIFGVN